MWDDVFLQDLQQLLPCLPDLRQLVVMTRIPLLGLGTWRSDGSRSRSRRSNLSRSMFVIQPQVPLLCTCSIQVDVAWSVNEPVSYMGTARWAENAQLASA